MSTNRLEHLRAYLGALATDMMAQGKFAARGDNKIYAAVNAVLAGGSAMAVQLAADLRAIGGGAAAMARPIVEGWVAGIAADAAKAAVGHGTAALADLFSGKAHAKREQRKAGKTIMDAARTLGQRK